MKKCYVLIYQENNIEGVFSSKKEISSYIKNNEIPRDIFKQEFQIVKTNFIK